MSIKKNNIVNLNTILFLGDSKIGKTYIINRYIHNTIPIQYTPSDFHTYYRFSKDIDINTYKFHIWESNYYNYFINNIDIIVFLFDINNLNTLSNLMQYIICIYKTTNNPYKIYIVATQIDILSTKLTTQYLTYINSYINTIKTNYFNNVEFIQVSALNNTNIDYLFNSIIETCIHKYTLKYCKVLSVSDSDSDSDSDSNNSLCFKCTCC